MMQNVGSVPQRVLKWMRAWEEYHDTVRRIRWRVRKSTRVSEEYDENIRGILWECLRNMTESARVNESVQGVQWQCRRYMLESVRVYESTYNALPTLSYTITSSSYSSSILINSDLSSYPPSLSYTLTLSYKLFRVTLLWLELCYVDFL